MITIGAPSPIPRKCSDVSKHEQHVHLIKRVGVNHAEPQWSTFTCPGTQP